MQNAPLAFFWNVPDYSRSFLIIPVDSRYCRLFLFFLDYSDYSHNSDYCLTMLTTCWNWNFCMVVLPLTGAVAEVSNCDDIPHAQKVVCFPPHDAAIQDAPPESSSKNVIDFCDHCNYCDNCDYCKYVRLFRLLHLCNLNNHNNHNNWNNLNNQNKPLSSCHFFFGWLWIIQIIQTIARIAIIVIV